MPWHPPLHTVLACSSSSLHMDEGARELSIKEHDTPIGQHRSSSVSSSDFESSSGHASSQDQEDCDVEAPGAKRRVLGTHRKVTAAFSDGDSSESENASSEGSAQPNAVAGPTLNENSPQKAKKKKKGKKKGAKKKVWHWSAFNPLPSKCCFPPQFEMDPTNIPT